MTTPLTEADLLQLRLDLDTAHREEATTGQTPTGAGLWRVIPALLATLDEAHQRIKELEDNMDDAQEALDLLDEVRAVVG